MYIYFYALETNKNLKFFICFQDSLYDTMKVLSLIRFVHFQNRYYTYGNDPYSKQHSHAMILALHWIQAPHFYYYQKIRKTCHNS